MAVLSPLFADFALARRIENADAEGGRQCVQALLRMRPGSGAAAEPVGGGWAIFTGVESPLTHTIAMGMNGPVNGDDFDRLEEFYGSRGASPTIDVCPLADASFLEQLSRRGYRPIEYNNVVVRPLAAGEEIAALPGVDVRSALAEEAEIWARTMMHGFLERENLTLAETELGVMIFRTNTGSGWLALVDGRPAGAGMLIVHGTAAACAADGTLPVFRRRGIQRALIQARLRHASAAGCEIAFAAALPGSISQRNYERAGFRIAYTKTITVLA